MVKSLPPSLNLQSARIDIQEFCMIKDLQAFRQRSPNGILLVWIHSMVLTSCARDADFNKDSAPAGLLAD